MKQENNQADTASERVDSTCAQSNDSAELRVCQQELTNQKNELLRAHADFENYKKRVDRDRAQWTIMAQTNILKDLLALLDDFERGLAYTHGIAIPDTMKAWSEGVLLTYEQAKKIVAKYGVTEINATQQFDPQIHEAVMYVDSPEHASGTIVQVMQKGYTVKDQVMRPARVSVAR